MTVKVEFSINTVELEVKYLYNPLNAAAICLRTSATHFSAAQDAKVRRQYHELLYGKSNLRQIPVL